ncbi:unnamed protein product [Oppiella nova]|uniref:CBF1-interacting co-repressor CIR N-terminal domain-containing protein n=1 Tax=Oppiella nova TaxID=334625 RepID=A0A7R9QUW0_9ACAR|nr:unnamed protein product [Oppiella nova]CAG2176460.1 unnamed protein product [Oppiella nova]
MNILHHKSWHVRNRNNIERVKRDEEKARNEELERQKRILLAESESRITLLRHRLKGDDHKTGDEDTEANGEQTSAAGSSHLDVFKDFGDKIKTKNSEYEKEVKDEKEKFETKTGILQYLVDKESDANSVWYLDSHEKRMKLMARDVDPNDVEKQLKDNKLKTMNDPIEDMKKYLKVMKSKSEDKTQKTNKQKTSHKSSKDVLKRTETIVKKKSKKSKKSKKHKKKRRKRMSSESSDDSQDDRTSSQNMSKSLEQLRAERLERERVERERTRDLLYGKTNKEEVVMDDRLRSYNSQFNPEIARQNADK